MMVRRRRGQQGDTWHLDELFVTTAPKSRTNRRDSLNARCGASNRPRICNASRRSNLWSRISSA